MFGSFGVWIQDNQILSGTGAVVATAIGIIGKKIFGKFFPKQPGQGKVEMSIDERKSKCKILFIDDEQFKVVDILKKAGWINVKKIKDISSLDDLEVRSSHIFFVDIQGVGKALRFQDEGLGLAKALKEKYPDKKVVIYSSENNGDRFHKALRCADEHLAKNADPFEFTQLVEQLSIYVEL